MTSHQAQARAAIAALRKKIPILEPEKLALFETEAAVQEAILLHMAKARDRYPPEGHTDETFLINQMINILSVALLCTARNFPQISLPMEVKCKHILGEVARTVKLIIDQAGPEPFP
jgi:hypothetical protein